MPPGQPEGREPCSLERRRPRRPDVRDPDRSAERPDSERLHGRGTSVRQAGQAGGSRPAWTDSLVRHGLDDHAGSAGAAARLPTRLPLPCHPSDDGGQPGANRPAPGALRAAPGALASRPVVGADQGRRRRFHVKPGVVPSRGAVGGRRPNPMTIACSSAAARQPRHRPERSCAWWPRSRP